MSSRPAPPYAKHSAKGQVSDDHRNSENSFDAILCFSHLRWRFVFQRPQHLMTRFARTVPVIFVEEPTAADPGAAPALDLATCPDSGVTVATPRLSGDLSLSARAADLAPLLAELVHAQGFRAPALWHYTPMWAPATRGLARAVTVYDCMDDLSAFRFAPPELPALEAELLAAADVVFTGGHSLYEAKRAAHADVHAFPSSVDVDHFRKARAMGAAPAGRRPTFGFYGVIDERVDLALVAALADARPEWTIEMVGPLAKIAEDDLPRRPNLAYPGACAYADLPTRLGAWDVALMPFAINEATRFISPTKTPEYLAGGRPVVSTPVRDVARGYGDLEAVAVADGTEAFVTACDAALALARGDRRDWRDAADARLAGMSWDETQRRMAAHLARAARARRPAAASATPIVRAPRAAGSGRAAPAPALSVDRRHFDTVVVGAGFAGAVMAERLAAEAGERVLVVDRRPHVAGNAYDRRDAAGLLIHEYGPHIFHTNSDEVFAYLSRFTRWRPYEHRVLGSVRGKLTPIPINRTTLNLLYDAGLKTDADAAAFLAARAEPVDRPKTSEDVVVSAVGRELYELFFRGYTRKQWGLDPSQLDRSVTARVPTRTNDDDRYFTDTHQAMPRDGYTAMFEAMLDHPNITVQTGVDWRDLGRDLRYGRLVYTGPIDEFFDLRYGPLPYRSLVFRHETLDVERFQPVGTVNYPDEATPYTRITEFKHLTGQTGKRTSVVYEYPSAVGDPYYPVPRPENQALYKRYEALAAARPEVVFVGRLASYRYYNMDQVVGQALATFRRLRAADVAARSAVGRAARAAGGVTAPAG
jgi:UDP-galactopyranose mutase